MIASLGTRFIFRLGFASFEVLEKLQQWNWVEQPIVGKYPRLSFVHKPADQITLRGVNFPGQLHIGNRIAEYTLTTLADLSAKKQKPIPFILGASTRALYMGQWVITMFRVLEEVFLAGSHIPRKINFEMTMKLHTPPPQSVFSTALPEFLGFARQQLSP